MISGERVANRLATLSPGRAVSSELGLCVAPLEAVGPLRTLALPALSGAVIGPAPSATVVVVVAAVTVVVEAGATTSF